MQFMKKGSDGGGSDEVDEMEKKTEKANRTSRELGRSIMAGPRE
jgi:hypothetical protein